MARDDKGKIISVVLVQLHTFRHETFLDTSPLYHAVHYESISNNFLCFQIFVLVHDIPSMNGRSAHLCAKCLMHEGTSCWCWPAADLDRFCTGNKHLV